LGAGLALPPEAAYGVLRPAARLVVPDLDAFQRSLGGRQRRSSEALRRNQEAALAEASTLVEPALVWARLDADGLAEPAGVPGEALAHVEALLGVVCTIGARLEARVHDYLAAQQYTRGFLLDQAGTLAVAQLARHGAGVLCVEQHAVRWAPGDDKVDLQLEAQCHLFAHVPAHLIGVYLNERHVMVPAMSLSYLLFVSSGPAGLQCLADCRRCLWHGSCEGERGRRRPGPRAASPR
jgi:hypothetical protein